MPFAVFRRHQRKLLAIFAILAMFGFVLADSVPRLLSGGDMAGGSNPTVVTLYGRPVRQSDLAELAAERTRANRFMAELFIAMTGFPPGRLPFGDTTTRSLVDAWILQHEADALKMPKTPDLAREWLKQRTQDRMSRDLFEGTLRRLGGEVTGQQILLDIANQIRLATARQLLGSPVVTPLDIFEAYRDQTEKVSARLASFPVEKYVASVPEPTADQVQAYYEKYKSVLPDPTRETPGFEIPRQIRVEILSLDGAALARQLRAKLTESELLTYYENRKAEFKVFSEFPADIFAGDPQATLTPPLVQPFNQVRDPLADAFAEEKAHQEIVNTLTQIRESDLIPFVDNYLTAVEKNVEAEKQGTPPSPLPKPDKLDALARRHGLNQEITPLLTRAESQKYGSIATARIGLTRGGEGRTFTSEFFDPKTALFEPIELMNERGVAFLARKIEDHPARVPPLDEIRAHVVRAWKLDQARPLAKKAAEEFAAQVRQKGGRIAEETVDGRPVIATNSVSRLQSSFPMTGMLFEPTTTIPSEIPQVGTPGDEFRDAYFGLRSGDVAVASNQPKTIYYVMTLNQRQPASFATLYAPNGDYIRYQRETFFQALAQREDEWMGYLRRKAGLDPNWVPQDERNRESDSQRG
jgi:peptidyl-prolyl cis-trans isomerase D